MKDVPPPRVHETTPGPAEIKNILDILAEADDWFAQEVGSSDAWHIPGELLNTEQKRKIFRIATRDGLSEACLLAIVNPYIHGIIHGTLRPLPELGITGIVIGLLVLIWPCILLPLFPLRYIQKIRGSITKLICWELVLGRALGLIVGAWVMAACFLRAPMLIETLFPPRYGLITEYLRPLVLKPFLYLQGTYVYLATESLISGLVPIIAIIIFLPRIRQKWEDIQMLVKGIV